MNWHLVWVIPIITIFVIVGMTVKGAWWKWLLGLIGLILLGLVLWFGWWLYNRSAATDEASSQATAALATSTPPPTTVERTLYLFSPEKEVITVQIKDGEVDFYPKGGGIEIITSKGEVVRDSPGTINPRRRFPSGEYKIKKIDPKTVGVEIWN